MRKVIFLLITFLSLPTTLWASDPFIGTWKLNVSKSRFTSAFLAAFGMAEPKQETIVIKELNDDEWEVIVTGTYSDESLNSQRQTVPKQGGIVKFQQGNPPEGSFYVETKISDKEKYRTFIQDGKQRNLQHIVMSQDGKEMTVAITGTNNQNKPFEALYFFEKQ
jgi:hypothetical protein